MKYLEIFRAVRNCDFVYAQEVVFDFCSQGWSFDQLIEETGITSDEVTYLSTLDETELQRLHELGYIQIVEELSRTVEINVYELLLVPESNQESQLIQLDEILTEDNGLEEIQPNWLTVRQDIRLDELHSTNFKFFFPGNEVDITVEPIIDFNRNVQEFADYTELFGNYFAQTGVGTIRRPRLRDDWLNFILWLIVILDLLRSIPDIRQPDPDPCDFLDVPPGASVADVVGLTDLKPAQENVTRSKVVEYARAMCKGAKFPPITILRFQDYDRIEDGHTRFVASRLANVPVGSIIVEVLDFDLVGTELYREWSSVGWWPI